MKLISAEPGKYPDINRLNHNFRADSNRIKFTIDTISPKSLYLDRFPKLLFTTFDLLPNIKKHRCTRGATTEAFRDYDMSHLVSPIKLIGDVIDTVHLLEHVVLELQCQIGAMPECSGLTCNYWEPENRYDVFIESDETELARFSCKMALDLFDTIIYGSEKEIDLPDLTILARRIYGRGTVSKAGIARDLAWSGERVSEKMARLEAFNFPLKSLKFAA